jgi:thiol-disulfide isomerase/thioredoxin
MPKAGKVAQKGLIDKELMFFIGIFILAGAGIVVVFYILPSLQPGENIPGNGSVTVNTSNGGQQPMSMEECLANYGISSNQVFFIYSDSCVYSMEMKPLVQQLENEGNRFVWVNVDNSSAIQITSTCLGGIFRYEGTPETICPSNKKGVIGSFSSLDELRAFVADCK